MSQNRDNHSAGNKQPVSPLRDSHSQSAPVSAAPPQPAPPSGPARSETRQNFISPEKICLEIHNRALDLARKKFPRQSLPEIQELASGAVAALLKALKNPERKLSEKCGDLGPDGAMKYVLGALHNNLKTEHKKLQYHKIRGEVLTAGDEIERLADSCLEAGGAPAFKGILNRDELQIILAEAVKEEIVFSRDIREALAEVCALENIAMPESLAASDRMSNRTRQRREAEGKDWLRNKIKDFGSVPCGIARPRAAGCPAPEGPLKSHVSLVKGKKRARHDNQETPRDAKVT